MEANYANRMNQRVFVLEQFYEQQLGKIRLMPGWYAAYDKAGLIWLKGPFQNGDGQKLLNALPVIASYLMDAGERLFQLGKQTPVARMEPMDWQPLSSFVTIEIPVAALPGLKPVAFVPKLIRSAVIKPAYAILTNWTDWMHHADSAPLVKLQQLKFAASPTGRVLVTGYPLPPVKGTYFWQNQSLLLPAGYDLDIPLSAVLWNKKLHTSADEWLLIDHNNQYERIPASAFTPANRSLIRMLNAQFV